MKILRIFGVVVGIHLLALILIFADPGCSVGKSQPTAPASGPPPASSPITPAPGASAAPITFSPDASAAGGALYPPTRPGTPAAASLAAQPVAGVTPAATYVVGSGDSLWIIAKKNHLKVSDLAAANNLRTGAPIHPGQKLIIPGKPLEGAGASEVSPEAAPAKASTVSKATASGTRYVVKQGESLRAIAHKFHVKLSAIAAANSISDPKTIYPGQELIIPGAHSAAAKPASDAALTAPPPTAPDAAQAPRTDSDLDAGLKPAASGDIPVVKVDDTSRAQK